jgi:RNA polymerase sigma-70 factor (ECF subfamily)
VDRELVERARDGDRIAFAAIAESISARLYGLATRILRDGDAAGDALQSALVEIWRDLPALREVERFDAWASRILVRRCQAELRARRIRPATVGLLPTDPPVEDHGADVDRREMLESAFTRLSPDQRAVVVLTYYRDLTVPQVATTLGVSEGTVKSRLHYARAALRAALDADERGATLQGRTA